MAAALTCLYENKYTAVRIVAFVLIIGVLWEVLEVTSGMTSIGDKGYILDTLDDLCFDMVGAYFMAVISPLFGPNFNLKLRSSRVK